MTDDKKQHHEHKGQYISEDIERLKEINEKHGKTITTILTIILISIIGYKLYNGYRAKKSAEMSDALMSAKTVQDLETIVKKYKTLPSAAAVKLELAKSYYDEANYDMALKTYNELKEKNAGQLPGIAAELGIAYCLEARGQTKDALKQFETFIKNNADSFLLPEAIMGKARCMDILAQTDEARQTLEDFIAANPDNNWVPQAEEMLKDFKKKLAQ